MLTKMCMFLHLEVGLSLYIITKRASQESEAPQGLLPAFKEGRLERKDKSSLHLSISPKGKP